MKAAKLGDSVHNQSAGRTKNSQSPIAILGAFVFLGAVIGITLYQFVRLHPQPPNIGSETVESPILASNSATVVPSETPLPAATIGPSDTSPPPTISLGESSLPPGCGSYSGPRVAHINELKTSRTLQERLFPAMCQNQLDELQYKYAIEKLAANDGNFQAAATMLCDVTDTHFKNDPESIPQTFFQRLV